MARITDCEKCPLYLEHRNGLSTPNVVDILTRRKLSVATKAAVDQNLRAGLGIFNGLVKNSPNCKGFNMTKMKILSLMAKLEGVPVGDYNVSACTNPFVRTKEFDDLRVLSSRESLIQTENAERHGIGLPEVEFHYDRTKPSVVDVAIYAGTTGLIGIALYEAFMQ